MSILLKALGYAIVIGLVDTLSGDPVDLGTILHIFLFAIMLVMLKDSDGR